MNRRNYKAAIALACFVVAMLVPLFVGQNYALGVLFRIALFAALGLAWNIVGGYAGQLSLGHAAFFGLGAYGLTLFHDRLSVPAWPALVLGIAIAVVAAGIIGLVAFRLRGPYFALATIAFAEVLHLAGKNLTDLTGGDVGIQPPGLFGADPSKWFYWAAVVLTGLVLAASVAMTRMRFGYSLQAIREDEDTAMACGINAAQTKLLAFALSAALTALGGALYASKFLYIVPDQMLSTDISIEIAVVAMLGGAGTLTGPIVGAILLETANELFKNFFHEAHLLIYGILIVIVVLGLPDGIVGTLGQYWRARKPATAAPAKAAAP